MCWKADREVRLKRLRGGGLKPGKKRIRRHCALSENCQVGLISGYIFIKAAFGSADMLTAHSFCGIPPRHQSLLSGSPIKAEGRLAARALPCLHLVNGRELTPISAERGGGGTQETRTVCVSLALFFFPCSLKHSLPFSSFPWPPFTTPIIPHFLAPSCRARTCQSIRCACETLMQIYTNSAPHMCKEKQKTKNTRPLVSTPTHTLRHQNTRVSSGFMLGAWLPTHTHTHTHTQN